MINEQLKLRCNSSGACSADSIEAQTIDTVDAVHIDSISRFTSTSPMRMRFRGEKRASEGIEIVAPINYHRPSGRPRGRCEFLSLDHVARTRSSSRMYERFNSKEQLHGRGLTKIKRAKIRVAINPGGRTARNWALLTFASYFRGSI